MDRRRQIRPAHASVSPSIGAADARRDQSRRASAMGCRSDRRFGRLDAVAPRQIHEREAPCRQMQALDLRSAYKRGTDDWPIAERLMGSRKHDIRSGAACKRSTPPEPPRCLHHRRSRWRFNLGALTTKLRKRSGEPRKFHPAEGQCRRQDFQDRRWIHRTARSSRSL